jgi:DNA-binding NarL/FixJ family response regulator
MIPSKQLPISVCLVEDERRTRESLVVLLKFAGLRCLGAYDTGEQALQEIPLEKPDVALVDINLPGMSGIECVSKLKTLTPSLQVLMLTTYQESDLIFNSLRAGAKGYVLKNMPPKELVEAIEELHAGGAPMSMQIARKVVNYFGERQQPGVEVDTLSKREQEVLALLAKGHLYKEIADHLGISLGSVRTYIQRIYEKLHVHSRTEAATKFLRRD